MDEIKQLQAAFILRKALEQVEALGLVVELEVPDASDPHMPSREVVSLSNLYVLNPLDSLDSPGLNLSVLPDTLPSSPQ